LGLPIGTLHAIVKPRRQYDLKPLKHIHKNKPTEYIATSFVREMPIFLTGNLVHSM
jgi:hypothetical protein